MKHLFNPKWLTLSVAAFGCLGCPAAQTIIETDHPSVAKSGPGFSDMFIKYGRVGMGSGDYIVTTSGTNSAFEYTVPAGSRSVSAMFLFHNQGQIADIYLDDSKCATVDTFARSSVAQRMGGVVGEIREVLISSHLDPAAGHKLRVVNTAASTSDSSYSPRALNQGPQLALDALRIGDFSFGTVIGAVKDESGRPLGDIRMTINSHIGPIKDATGTVVHTDGFGRYSLSGLTRGSSYTLQTSEPGSSYSTDFIIPTESGLLVKDIVLPILQISRPRTAAPALALRGGTVEIEIEAKADVSGWSAKLKNAYKTINLPLDSVIYGPTNILDRSRAGWRIKLAVPSDTPMELWDLEISCSRGTRLEQQCVKVLDTFDRDFYVAQITDVHCYGDSNAKNDIRMSRMLSALDIIGARFIAITGDLCHFKGVRQAWGGFMTTLTGSCSDTPTCVIPGNHDTLEEDNSRGVSRIDVAYNQALYERLIGPRRYDLLMGDVYVLADDIFSGEPKWAGQKLAARAGQDQIRLVLSHYHFLEHEPASGPTILLYGHNHINERRTNGVPPHTYPALSVLTTKDQSKPKQLNEFRLVRFNREKTGKWSLGTYTYTNSFSQGVPAAEPGADMSSLNIRRTYAGPNDGTQSSNTVSFFNNTAERFETCLARFVMPTGLYKVTGGRVLDSYPSDDRTKSIVLVQVNAAPFATTTASIAREASL